MAVRQHDMPEEVVRREEREVAAEVAIALHDVVDLLRHVLLVAGEDDEVVELREIVARRKLLEILVGEVVGLLAGVHEEAQEPALVRAVVRRLARVEVRPTELDVVAIGVAVPRVAASRHRSRRRSCRPATCRWGGRPRRGSFPARRGVGRRARTRLPVRPAPSGVRSTGRSDHIPGRTISLCTFPRPSRHCCGGPHGRPTLLQPRSAPARMNCSSSRLIFVRTISRAV